MDYIDRYTEGYQCDHDMEDRSEDETRQSADRVATLGSIEHDGHQRSSSLLDRLSRPTSLVVEG